MPLLLYAGPETIMIPEKSAFEIGNVFLRAYLNALLHVCVINDTSGSASSQLVRRRKTLSDRQASVEETLHSSALLPLSLSISSVGIWI